MGWRVGRDCRGDVGGDTAGRGRGEGNSGGCAVGALRRGEGGGAGTRPCGRTNVSLPVRPSPSEVVRVHVVAMAVAAGRERGGVGGAGLPAGPWAGGQRV